MFIRFISLLHHALSQLIKTIGDTPSCCPLFVLMMLFTPSRVNILINVFVSWLYSITSLTLNGVYKCDQKQKQNNYNVNGLNQTSDFVLFIVPCQQDTDKKNRKRTPLPDMG